MAGVTSVGDGPAWWTVAVPVTSTRDGFEHLVADGDGMTPGSAGRYVALCGRAVWAAALVCPPGPRCRACVAVCTPEPASVRRHRREQRSRLLWAWLNPVWRLCRRAAWATEGAPDAD